MQTGGRRATGRRRGIVLTSAACCAALALAWAAPGPAEAAGAPADARAAKPKDKDGKPENGGREDRALGQLNRAGCPPYRAISELKYSSEARRAARRWKFTVFHFQTRLKPPIDWEQDPYQSRSYRQNLHGLTWIDTLLYAYGRTGDEATLRQARDIALDWIKSIPRRFRPGRRGFAWHPKSASDRATYLGYVTRAAGCKGLLNAKQARILVRSLNAHGKYLANGAEH